jgi:hypothetical protein
MAKQASTRETPLAQWQKHIASLEQKPTQRAQNHFTWEQALLGCCTARKAPLSTDEVVAESNQATSIQKERVATQTPRTTKSAQEESCPEGNCSILPQGRNQVTSRPNRGGTGASLSGRRTTMPTLNEMYNPENWARATKLRGLSHQRGSICQGARHARRVERPRLMSSAWDASNARVLS